MSTLSIYATLVSVNGQYYLAITDGQLTLEEALAQGKACPIDKECALATGIALLKAYSSMP